MNASEGRIIISMEMGKKKLKERLTELNGSRNTNDLRDKLRSLKIWRVSFLEKKEEDEVPGNGWCGYVAMNQIINNDDYASKMDDDMEIGKLRETVNQFFKVGHGGMVSKWKGKITSRMTTRETLLSVGDTLSNWKGRLSSKLERARWMNSKNLYGTCGKWKYSQWGEDKDDIRYCELRDSPMSMGSVTNHAEWRWIMRNNMLIGRDNHYYVRRGSMESEYEVAFGRALDQATNDISDVLWPNGEPGEQDQDEGNDGSNEAEDGDEVIIVGKQRRGKSRQVKDLRNAEGSKLVGDNVKIPSPLGEQGFKDLNENGEKLEYDKDTIPTEKRKLGKLKIIFWNSNGWDTDRCDKIAELAKEEDADVVCIQDSRMDPHREQHLKGYMNVMEKVTGKKWRGRMVCRPGKRLGCMVGGSLLLTSHNCVDVRRVGILNYGVADKIDMKWMNEQVTIIPTYRPCRNKAVGSLRSAMGNESDNFEERYWDSIGRCLSGQRIIWGGDFNLCRNDLIKKITGMDMELLELEEDAYTYIAEVGGEEKGRVIDHALVKGCKAKSTVTENGSFVRDHIPLVVTVDIMGMGKKEGKRKKEFYPTMIRAGDEGAKKKLEKAMKKHLSGELNDWSMDEIISWTVSKSKEIAKGRNRKDNPNGWSPLTRIMRLRAKLVGAVHKRLEKGKDIGVCYKLFKEVKNDIMKMELSEEEKEWLQENGIEIDLPDWQEFKRWSDTAETAKEVKHLNKMTSSKLRRELRLKHDEWIRKIQEEADKGSIGRVLKRIIGEEKDFTLDVLYGKLENITDAEEIARIITKFFEEWFSMTEEGEQNDDELSRFSELNDRNSFLAMTGRLGIKEEAANSIFEGLKDKEIPEEGRTEGEALSKYTPTLDEFKSYIKALNPRSAGGPSGLTYLLVQYWPENVKERIYNAIREAWDKKSVIKGWGRRLLKTIPKIKDAGLSDLRPLMLIEVMRKIWAGLVMNKIAKFWEKWGLVDKSQHAYLRGKGTHTVLPQLLNCLEGARDFATSLFISSWDMRRAFDSVGRRFLLWCLVRLKVPRELASYMISMDDEGEVFVKCPHNMEIAERGIAALDKEGMSFKTKKGVGQGDTPSPLFWVAVLDTLLTALRKNQVNSKYRTLTVKPTRQMTWPLRMIYRVWRRKPKHYKKKLTWYQHGASARVSKSQRTK